MTLLSKQKAIHWAGNHNEYIEATNSERGFKDTGN